MYRIQTNCCNANWGYIMCTFSFPHQKREGRKSWSLARREIRTKFYWKWPTTKPLFLPPAPPSSSPPPIAEETLKESLSLIRYRVPSDPAHFHYSPLEAARNGGIPTFIQERIEERQKRRSDMECSERFSDEVSYSEYHTPHTLYTVQYCAYEVSLSHLKF